MTVAVTVARNPDGDQRYACEAHGRNAFANLGYRLRGLSVRERGRECEWCGPSAYYRRIYISLANDQAIPDMVIAYSTTGIVTTCDVTTYDVSPHSSVVEGNTTTTSVVAALDLVAAAIRRGKFLRTNDPV